ncbi:MAG: heparinase II/III family protein [Ignavibacteria bacterium]
MKKLVTRRNFLEKSLLCTGVAVSGTLMSSILKADSLFPSAKLTKDSDSRKEGVFPFYEYINDYNFGEYIPKDQGGKFVQMELIGTEEDKKIAEIVKSGLIEKNLGNPPDWSIFEKTELEKSVWFNRFYYLPSFARLYYLDKNNGHIKFMMELLKNWIKENPVEGPSKSKYNWFDMQAAWRSINLSWCYYLAKDGLPDSDKEVIYNLQGQHAKILMKDFGKKELNEFNHQSHGALAILYLAILFPALPEAGELLKTGLKIIKHHVDHAFYEDGGNVEQMFGYYPFMTSVFRDAYLLCKANNVGEPEHSLPLLGKMYRYLSAIAQPDNTVPPINDSYEETVSYILPTLAGIIGENNLPKLLSTTYFKDSQIGVIRSELNTEKPWYINVNAAKLIGSHAHAGRLAVNVWYNNKPVLVDSGCCNYDNPLLVEWYRTSKAHNTVLIDGKSDFATSQKEVQWAAKRYTDNIIEHLLINPEYKFYRTVSPETDETNSGVKWTRDVALILDKYLIIHDWFECDGQHKYETVFRFADIKVNPVQSTNKLLIDPGDKIALIHVSEGDPAELIMEEAYFGSHAKNIKTPTSIYQLSNNGTLHSTFLIKGINNKADIEKIKVSQKTDDMNCRINLTDESGQKICMSIANGEVDEKHIFSLTKGR